MVEAYRSIQIVYGECGYELQFPYGVPLGARYERHQSETLKRVDQQEERILFRYESARHG